MSRNDRPPACIKRFEAAQANMRKQLDEGRTVAGDPVLEQQQVYAILENPRSKVVASKLLSIALSDLRRGLLPNDDPRWALLNKEIQGIGAGHRNPLAVLIDNDKDIKAQAATLMEEAAKQFKVDP